MAARTVDELNQRLSEALDFTTDDLAANRNGVISQRQRGVYIQRAEQLKRRVVPVALVGTAAVLMSCLLLNLLMGNPPVPLWFILLLLFVESVGTFISWLYEQTFIDRLKDGMLTVRQFSGKVTFLGPWYISDSKERSHVSTYDLHRRRIRIGRDFISVRTNVSSTFLKDRSYRVYCLRCSWADWIIMSAEFAD